ncbi:MAG: hypothetical protein QOD01_2707 [Actinomycetota bacterium]|jgi:hypothetical protein|nr:hypothetical protein [Actinomycetota bacterium]
MDDKTEAASGSADFDEEAVFAELKRVIGDSDPVPDAVVEAALASRTWRRADAELAELVYDSVVDAALVRSSRGARQLTFEAPGLTVEVEVGPSSLEGQLVPPQPGWVEVRHPQGRLTVDADRHGHFRVEAVLHGPVSLRCQPDLARSPTVTSWVVL